MQWEVGGRRTGKVLEDQVAQRHRARVRLEGVLPVLVDAQPVQTGLGPEVLEGDVGDVPGAPGVGLDEGDVVALDDADVFGDLPLSLRSVCDQPTEEMRMTYNVGDLGRDVQAANGDPRAGLVADQVLDQGVVGRALDGDAFVAVGDLPIMNIHHQQDELWERGRTAQQTSLSWIQ